LNLHNIYYRYLTNCYKNSFKHNNIGNFNFNIKINDARQSIKEDKNIYNLIFLDAFTPSKCPCLWSYDFFKELYNHLEEDGMILTYSNSAQVRNAFLNSGFFVGKIYSDNYKKYSGTIATKKEALIKTHLSEYDLGLIKTKAGIFYRDENLNLSNEAIIRAHNEEVENSNLISSSKFIKQYKKEHPNEEV
jgi:spermidine synthase